MQSDGNDGNTGAGCPSSSPCRTFQAALSVVDDGGNVVALDSGDFGMVTIKQSVAIIGNGAAGIVVPGNGYGSTIGVTIAGKGINVVLRGLNIGAVGLGGTGVYLKEGKSLQIEKCVLSNFFRDGLEVAAPASVRIVDTVMRGNSGNGASIRGGATADVVRSQFMGNGSSGLSVTADAAGTTSAVVSDSVASSNGYAGFFVNAGDKSALGRMVVTGSTAAHNTRAGFLSTAYPGEAILTVGRSAAARNGIGFWQIPSPVGGLSSIETMGDNSVQGNGTAATGVVVAVPPM
ncbi:hypothetical protein BWI17_15475 [Betaproteobacteria bacterium GR16-43]|nr:hypothetical protein BWI17_15475 [Betaproteobacteria bacterium GR16-43]